MNANEKIKRSLRDENRLAPVNWDKTLTMKEEGFAMKKYLIFIAVAFLALGMADKAMASTKLKGVILENRPGGPPLPGVVVSAPGAEAPRKTTNSGRFRLEFLQKQPGDMVLLTCAKEGMEVVNDM